MFTGMRRAGLATLICTTACLLTAASAVRAAEPNAEQLTRVLQSDASLHEKAVACKKLAVAAGKDAIPVLEKLLADAKLSHYARFALEPIPDPGVDVAFRNALKSLSGPQRIGVINSIARRRDTGAVPQLRGLLKEDDSETRAAALAALGKIADEASVETLLERLSSESEPLRVAAADASLACAQQLLDENDKQQAMRILKSLRGEAVPKPLRLAATRMAILAEKSVPLLAEQLRSTDDALFAVGLQTARQLEDPSVTQALLSELASASPTRQAGIIATLGDRGDKAGRGAVLKAAISGAKPARVAALRSLGQLGDALSVPILLRAARQDDPEIAAAAMETLSTLQGEQIDSVIVARLDQEDLDAASIKLIGRRRITSAVPILLKAAESSDRSIRLAAIASLGETAGPETLDRLANMVAAPASPDEAAAATRALAAACIRTADRDANLSRVIRQLSGKSLETKTRLYEVLREVGGPTALKTVVAGASGSDDAVQDLATRVLGEWLTADAAPELLSLARNLKSDKYKYRALNGYVRIIRQFGLPVEQRVRMARLAMEAAERGAEKKRVLQALVRFPAPKSLDLAVRYLEDPELKATSAASAVTIAENLLMDDSSADVADAMNKVLAAGVGQAVKDRAQAVLEKREG